MQLKEREREREREKFVRGDVHCSELFVRRWKERVKISASRRYHDRVIDLVKLQPAVGRRPSRYKLPPDKQVDGARDETRRC